MDSIGIGVGWLYVIGVLFMIVLMVAWLLLPFAMIGTKGLLRELLQEQKETNRLLASRVDVLPPGRT